MHIERPEDVVGRVTAFLADHSLLQQT
jgi:hypothetical protein